MLSTSPQGRKKARADGRGYAPDTARLPCEGVRKDAEDEHPNRDTGSSKPIEAGKFAPPVPPSEFNEETKG